MTVYKKTQKGMNELLARSPSIDVRIFNVLVLVDGVRESAEVNALAVQADLPVDALEILFHGGFIEKKYKGSSALPPAEAAVPAPPKPPPAPKPPKAAPAPDKYQGFNNLYSYLVAQTKALLGLRGFMYQLRIERATTAPELKALIGELGEAIARKHGVEVARAFAHEGERLANQALAERMPGTSA